MIHTHTNTRRALFVCSEVRWQANRLDSSVPRSKQVQESVWHLPRQRHPGRLRVEVERDKREHSLGI